MAKKKVIKKQAVKKRPAQYEDSTLKIIGTLDDVLKVSVPPAKK